MRSRLNKLKRYLIHIERWVASLSLSLLLGFTLTQIVARNFFDTGFPLLDMISRHLVLFITFMGAALISEYNRHIKIDILASILSIRQRRALARPLLFITAIVCAFFVWYSAQFWWTEWQYSSQHERWQVVFALILPVGFGIVCVHLLLLVANGLEYDRSSMDK